MSDAIVAVIGAGVIGTSIGLALKRNENVAKLIVHDKEPAHTRQAMKMGAFDQSEWNLINATEPADLIILAIPSPEIKATLEAIGPYLKQDAIISDVSESKQDILAMAGEILPDQVHFVGGNPIVSAPPGPENARADLFEKNLYCLTPAAGLIPEAVQLLDDLIHLIGATAYYLDPAEHDGLMSGVNLLPTLLSTALVNGVSRQPAWVEMRRLAGGLFAQVASGASGDPDAVVNRLLANKANTLRWLDISIEILADLKKLIDADDQEELAQQLDDAFVTRINWQKDFSEARLSNLIEPLSQTTIDEPSMFQRMFSFGGLFKRGQKKDEVGQEAKNTARRR